MKFDSSQFLIFITFSLIIFHSLRRFSIISFVLGLINVVFLLSFAPSVKALIPLLMFVFLSYIFVCYLYDHPNNKVLAVFIGVIIISFLYLKKYSLIGFIPSLNPTYTLIGLSYILFRVLQVVVDVYDRNISKKISPLEYFNFIFLFPCFVSGPIQRYQDFYLQQQSLPTKQHSSEDVLWAFSRIVNGYIKVVFLSSLMTTIVSSQYFDFDYVLNKLHGHGVVSLSGWYVFALINFLFTLYMNFSGYMDIVIGLGKLFYFDLPENFNQPFTSKNFLDFWGRWHITLSEWFKIYFFNPVSKLIMYRFGSPSSAPYVGVVVYFLAFFIMGIWHGTTLIFVVYGLLLGLGMSVNKLYQVLARNSFGKKGYARLENNVAYQYLCTGLAISYFSMALTCFWLSIHQFLSLFGHLAWAVLLMTFFILTVFFSFTAVLGDLIKKTARVLIDKRKDTLGFFIFRQSWLAVRLFFLIHLFLNNINPIPPFIYQAF